jgi:molybdopterin-containing oxidoreductase family iron-sulfur binding subunit
LLDLPPLIAMPPNPRLPVTKDAPEFWRSLDERALTPEFQARLAKEFPFVATLPPSELDRRNFVKLMGASIALAGLSGCVRRSVDKIVPYVAAPEIAVTGRPDYYATAMPVEGYARGIIVESHLGRPTKIEGNSDHPESLGATDAITQAAILSLYDPDRSREPWRQGRAGSWADFDAESMRHQATLFATQGEGLALLAEPTSSPSIRRELQRIREKFPKARWYQHTPLAGYEANGRQPDYDFAAAEVIFTIGSDCLYRHPAALRYSRAFAGRRRVVNGQVRMNRFYAMEATPTVTGALADFRLPASPARMRAVLDALAQVLAQGAAPSPAGLSPAEDRFVTALAADLRHYAPAVVCVAGPEEDADLQRWALALNAHLGAAEKTIRFLAPPRSDSDVTSAGDLAALTGAMRRGEVTHLLVLSSNPAYTAPSDLDFASALGHVPFTVHLGGHRDETAALCTWHLPESHWLETWSDLRGYEGTATILQPLIEPLYDTRGSLEILRQLTAPPGDQAYDIVRETWRNARGGSDFELHWHRWLNVGVVEGSATSAVAAPSTDGTFPVLTQPVAEALPALVLQPDATIGDGRWANNAWLQELPKPLTSLVWDNAALVSPAFAAKLMIASGDLLALSIGPHTLDAAALILPGQADDCVTLSLGYGRSAAGSVGNGHGFNAYRLRTTKALWRQSGLRVEQTGRRYALATTQQQFAMEGRDLVRVVTPDALSVPPPAASPTLYPPWKSGGYAWGMSIDLSTCLGCNACIVACQAENNIPVVGKDQVARGRQMHWIRVDTYFSGDPASPSMVHQPVPCMQCENAPCELVCPVGATVHSDEGLNDMVYNRCVGTRYCSNNCPYKVRRFNFYDYRSPPGALSHLQENPDVTVRERGVMEKCTYCVQRINTARITAEKEGRPIRDGEIKTACQQACPAEAIVFGNLADPGSRVSRRKSEPTNYLLLEELNTRPRTTYLAKVRQPTGGVVS